MGLYKSLSIASSFGWWSAAIFGGIFIITILGEHIEIFKIELVKIKKALELTDERWQVSYLLINITQTIIISLCLIVILVLLFSLMMAGYDALKMWADSDFSDNVTRNHTVLLLGLSLFLYLLIDGFSQTIVIEDISTAQIYSKNDEDVPANKVKSN